jgi:general secretion pathway protein C
MKRHYHTWIVLLGLTLVIYLGVDVFYTALRIYVWDAAPARPAAVSPGPAGRADPRPPVLRDYRILFERDLFGSSPTTPPVRETVDVASLKSTTLKLALLGTITGSPDAARAVIEETDSGKQGLFRAGDTVKDATVKQILRGKVVLRVGDHDEVLAVGQPSEAAETGPRTGPGPAAGEQVVVDAQALKRSPKGALQLLSEIRMRPHVENGRREGLEVAWIQPDSVFGKFGLNQGDVVRQVDGRPVNSLDEMVSLYKRLEAGGRVSLVVTRQGETRTLTYSLK